MVTIVGVRFKKAGKIYYFSPGDLQIAAGDGCIVETARGVEYGKIVIAPREVSEDEVVQPLRQVLRSANTEDYERLEVNKLRAEEAFQIAVEKVAEHKLPMKLLEAEYTLDDSKLIFSFTAEGRVDFRELVKDLAAIFRTRIELRQVGVRDEAKIVGGLGSCGRGLCCATFLGEFEPVSIKMAKEQNLSLNPTKISGVCGRLMCCLKYEAQSYEDNKQVFGKCGKSGPVVADEFYHEMEEESDYYDDLLKEDSIKEVDYQMMLETAEIEKNTVGESKKPPKRASRPKKKRKPKAAEGKPPVKAQEPAKEDEQAKAAAENSPKKRRRPRRRKSKPKPEVKGE